jgi:hypothetical protein
MKKILSISAVALFAGAPLTHAVCPVCTVAVGAGLGLAEWLGIDDTISGLWIGGFAVSLIIWTINWLNKKEIRFKGRKILVTVGYYLLIVGPLWWKGFIGRNPFDKFCGMDRLLFGIILGTVLFSAGVIVHNYLFKKNEGKSHFKGQKIAVAIAPLVIASIILYFIC